MAGVGAGPPPGPQVVVPGAGWVDVATKAVTQVGFPVVIAGVLLWFLLTRFQDNMTQITSHMSENAKAITSFLQQQKEELSVVQSQSGEMSRQTQTLQEIAASLRVIAASRQMPPPPPQ